MSTSERIEILFKNGDYPNYKRVIEYYLCIPVSNAHVERSFSLLKNSWTDNWNRLSIDSLKAELLIKYNYNMDCTDFYRLLKRSTYYFVKE